MSPYVTLTAQGVRKRPAGRSGIRCQALPSSFSVDPHDVCRSLNSRSRYSDATVAPMILYV